MNLFLIHIQTYNHRKTPINHDTGPMSDLEFWGLIIGIILLVILWIYIAWKDSKNPWGY